MSTPMIIMLIVLVVLIGVCVALYFFGKKAQKKQAEQQQQMDAVAQTVSMLIIDKKKMKLKDAGLPAVKKEAKVVVSGIYITGIKSVRGGLDIPEKKKKKGFFSKKEK